MRDSEVFLVPFILLQDGCNMGIQDTGISSIYISFHFPHISQRHNSPPIYEIGEGLLFPFVKTLTHPLVQRFFFTILLCNRGRLLFTCECFHLIISPTKYVNLIKSIIQVVDYGEDLVALEHYF